MDYHAGSPLKLQHHDAVLASVSTVLHRKKTFAISPLSPGLQQSHGRLPPSVWYAAKA